MAGKKVLVTGRNDLPEKKINVSRDWMLEWMDKYGELEDVEWFEKVCADNPATFISNLDGKTYDIPDWAKVRAEFLKKYFPNAYKKQPKAKKVQMKYNDRLEAIKARKAMERDQMKIEDTTSSNGKK